MKLDYSQFIGKRVKIVCIFGDIKKPIYYDGEILEYDADGCVVKIRDRFSKIVFLDADSIKQVVLEGD